MKTLVTFRVQSGDFDVAAEIDRLKQISGDVGAVVTFSGICRADDGRLAALELEHYPGMAEGEIDRIAKEAAVRWPLAGITIIHRSGTIPVGDNIVLVVTASKHRDAAFDAASFLMDFLKTRAPFWKKEHLVVGKSDSWVAAQEGDEATTQRWKRDGTE